MHPVRATASITHKIIKDNEFDEVCLPVETKIIKDNIIHMIHLPVNNFMHFIIDETASVCSGLSY